MKLLEIFDDTPQFELMKTLMKKGKTVVLDFSKEVGELRPRYVGEIIDVIHATGPGTDNFLIWYWTTAPSGKMKDAVRIQRDVFERLKLYKNDEGQWVLSDKMVGKPDA